MSISTGARASRIDNHYTGLAKKFNALNSEMHKIIAESRVATAFMHDDPSAEFDQVDRDKYSDLFVQAIMGESGLFAAVELLQPMLDVEQDTKTPEQFVAEETGYNAVEYSAQFDKA